MSETRKINSVWELLKSSVEEGCSDQEITDLYIKAVIIRMRDMAIETLPSHQSISNLHESEAWGVIFSARTHTKFTQYAFRLAAAYLGYNTPQEFLEAFRTRQAEIAEKVREKLESVPHNPILELVRDPEYSPDVAATG